MKRYGTMIYLLTLFGIMAGCGAGGYVVANRLSSDMVTALTVTAAVLAIVAIVGGLLIANNAMVARSIWSQMALHDRLRGQRPPSVNIRLPPMGASHIPRSDSYSLPPGDPGYRLPGGMEFPPVFVQRGYGESAAFRDLTGGNDELEIE